MPLDLLAVLTPPASACPGVIVVHPAGMPLAGTATSTFARGSGGGQLRERGCREQGAHIRPESRAAHPLHQRDCQQRVAAQLEEVIVPAYALHAAAVPPDRRQRLFDLPLRRFISRRA